MSRFWSPFVHDLVPYVPGEQPKLSRLVKLNTNENPYGPSPRALEAIRNATDDSLKLYPDPDSSVLKQAIAKYYSVDTSQVFVGNGSDEVLAHLFLGFFKQDKPLLFPDITYSFYKVYCGLYQIDYQTIALADDFVRLGRAESIGEARFAPVDIAVLFAGAARVPRIDAALTLTSADAAEAARRLGARTAVGVHTEDWQHFSEGRAELEAAFAAAGMAHLLAATPRGERVGL